RVGAWSGLSDVERELDARPVADALYHALVGALLLAEGQALLAERQSARKLLAANLYLKKWLRPPAPPPSLFPPPHSGLLPALLDWAPIGVEVLAPDGGC